MFVEYLTNMYILALIATIIGLFIVYIYDKFEKKQYTNSVYFRIGILIYISCIATIYISKLDILQFGGSNTNNIDNPQNYMQQPNEIRNNFEQFKTGIPTF
jgi:hypothetical protein